MCQRWVPPTEGSDSSLDSVHLKPGSEKHEHFKHNKNARFLALEKMFTSATRGLHHCSVNCLPNIQELPSASVPPPEATDCAQNANLCTKMTKMRCEDYDHFANYRATPIYDVSSSSSFSSSGSSCSHPNVFICEIDSCVHFTTCAPRLNLSFCFVFASPAHVFRVASLLHKRYFAGDGDTSALPSRGARVGADVPFAASGEFEFDVIVHCLFVCALD